MLCFMPDRIRLSGILVGSRGKSAVPALRHRQCIEANKAISINADAEKRQIMKIQDMILVMENIKGRETNMLMTLQEYKDTYLFVSSLSREESAELLKELSDTRSAGAGTGWAERYITANKSYYAKFCSGSDELQCFLHGIYNDDKDFRFDREESSVECLRALEEYNLDINGGAKGNIFHYEQEKHDFKQGDIVNIG